jgi:formate dehydrogenase iron-sulfur subunit
MTKADQKYIVCNADEGDSGTFADRMIMEGDPLVLIEGMAICAHRSGRDQRLRLHRARNTRTSNAKFEKALADSVRAQRRLSGPGRVCGSYSFFDIELRIGAGAYVCGEETALLESLEGKPRSWCGPSRLCPRIRASSASRR